MRRIYPLLEIDAGSRNCASCMYLQAGTVPRCALFTGTLDNSSAGPLRADECIDAESSATKAVTP